MAHGLYRIEWNTRVLTTVQSGLYGGQDTGIPLDTVETMRHALRAANAKADIVVYPDAGHAFNADYRPSYHETELIPLCSPVRHRRHRAFMFTLSCRRTG